MSTADPALAEPPTIRVNERLDNRGVWSDDDLSGAGIDVRDVAFVTVGGGLGSFALVDVLRMTGTATSDIAIVSANAEPQDNFEALCTASQLSREGKLRSDSSSRIDNVWGFPGYALGDAWRRKSLMPLVHVTTEPVLSEYFNPTGGQIFDSVQREAHRIGWASMLVRGRAIAIRRRAGGGFFVVVEPSAEKPADSGVSEDLPNPVASPVFALRAKNVHVCTGYPAVNVTPELAQYRSLNPDSTRTTHSYEPHERIYETLARDGGTVLVRGSGDTTAHILHRLCSTRARTGSDIRILHLVRDFIAGPTPFPAVGRVKRPGRNGFALQQFVFPRAAGGGQIARVVAGLGEDERTPLLMGLGAPSKPKMRSWERELSRGRREGWYRAHEGEAEELAAAPDGRIDVSWRSPGAETSHDLVDFVIDATGVVCAVDADPLLADMVASGIGGANQLGRLAVGPSFELGMAERHEGRAYASGAITFGGPVIPVAVFWGLHYAALRIAADLANQGLCERLTSWRSTVAWLKWAGKVNLP